MHDMVQKERRRFMRGKWLWPIGRIEEMTEKVWQEQAHVVSVSKCRFRRFRTSHLQLENVHLGHEDLGY